MSIFDIFAKLEQSKSVPCTGPITWMIVGLGNPGERYSNTRHNAGFLALDAYAEKNNLHFDQIKFKSTLCDCMIGEQRVLLLKPQTFMNLSGEAVRDAAAFYKIPPERIIVIFDDISLDVGRLRIRAKGSAGGQNGVKNIIYHLQSEQFPRIKMGIGNKPHPDFDLADWVLSQFSKSEAEIMHQTALRAMQAAEEIIQHGTASAAQKFNSSKEK